VKKLLKLKEWLTVPDAARHLSILFGEEVSEADVLRLALDGHLTLSVNLVNHTACRCGPILSREAATRSFEGKFDVVFGQEIRDGEFWQEGKEVTHIVGVWDLPMLEAERDDVEHRYQMLTNGPAVKATTMEGPRVSREDGTMCRLLDNFSDDGSDGLLKPPPRYYPAFDLPSDSVLVVRIPELRKLEARILEPERQPEKPLERRERTTLLVIVAALAKLAKIDVTKPSSAAAAIESQLTLMGTRVAARTIENHLNRVREALESRSEE
jgi:hypothetical protein